MIKILSFWLLSMALLVSWEALLIQPIRLFYWLAICLISSAVLGWLATKSDENTIHANIDRLVFVVFSLGVFWWLLWIDYEYLKFAFPVIVWVILLYSTKDLWKSKSEVLNSKTRLVLFFGGIFFWSAISFGLISVVGWQIWHAIGLFMVSFAILSYSVIENITISSNQHIQSWLLLLLISAEVFSVIVWLPFTESTLALILTIISLFTYDLLKYFINPELIRKKIILKKIIVYVVFLIFILVSTPWY